MLFSRVVSFFAFFFTFGALALATPLEGRQTSDIETVLNTLKSTTDAVAPELQALATNGSASDATVGPLVDQIVSALNTAKADLPTSATRVKRQDASDIATILASILTDVTDGLSAVLTEAGAEVPGLSGFLGTLDTALSEVLDGVELLLAGVLTLVADLLTDVSGLLKELSLGLTEASLGL